MDGTVGSGGHSIEIIRHLPQNSHLICLDRDPEAVRISKARLKKERKHVTITQSNFSDLDRVMQNMGIQRISGVLLDLGMSSNQLEKSGRGFSFSRNEPLDMRMDPEMPLTGSQLINDLPEKDFQQLLKKYGEETRAKAIARAVLRAREKGPIRTASELADIVESATSKSHRPWKRHPATKTFQALRIAVNKELDHLKVFLEKIPDLMEGGGRLVIISYHSLEDRLVKQKMAEWEKPCTCPPDFPVCVCNRAPLFKRLFKKGLKPDSNEIKNNPRARSAIMRIAERIAS